VNLITPSTFDVKNSWYFAYTPFTNLWGVVLNHRGKFTSRDIMMAIMKETTVSDVTPKRLLRNKCFGGTPALGSYETNYFPAKH
jgi:hypothetical protein